MTIDGNEEIKSQGKQKTKTKTKTKQTRTRRKRKKEKTQLLNNIFSFFIYLNSN